MRLVVWMHSPATLLVECKRRHEASLSVAALALHYPETSLMQAMQKMRCRRCGAVAERVTLRPSGQPSAYDVGLSR